MKTTEKILNLISDSKTTIIEREEEIKKNQGRDLFIFAILIGIWLIAILYSNLFLPLLDIL